MDNVFNSGLFFNGTDGPSAVFSAEKVGVLGTGVMVAVIVLGLLLCFLGLKIIRFLVALLGLGVGAAVGTSLMNQFEIQGLTRIIVVFACAILLSALAFFIYRAGIFLMVFSVVGVIGLACIHIDVTAQVAIVGGVALVLGILAAIFAEPIVIVFSALGGGILAGFGIGTLAELPNFAIIAIGIVLAIVGILVQFKMFMKKAGKKEKEHSRRFRRKNSMESEVEKARMLLDDSEEDNLYTEDLKSESEDQDIEIIDDNEM